MKNGFSSDTAVTTAILRAVHLLLDDQPPIFRDELAGALVGMRDDAEVLAAASAFERELATLSTPDHARANVTARARYAEDELEKACSTSRRGVIAKKAAPRSPIAENRAGPSFQPAYLAARLAALGFARIQDRGPEEADALYFASRSDGLRFPRQIHLMKAQT